MTVAAYLGRGVLAGVLLLAVLVKSSRDGRAAYLTVIDELSPWPAKRSPLLAVLVLVVELVVTGALVLPVVPAAVALSAAVLLLLAFTLALLKLIGSGTSSSCACFGAWSQGRLGPVTIARNLALIGLALLSLGLSNDAGRPGWTVPLMALVVTLGLGALGQVVLAGRRPRPAIESA